MSGSLSRLIGKKCRGVPAVAANLSHIVPEHPACLVKVDKTPLAISNICDVVNDVSNPPFLSLTVEQLPMTKTARNLCEKVYSS